MKPSYKLGLQQLSLRVRHIRMSENNWVMTIRLGSWHGKIVYPKSKYKTAQEAINAAIKKASE